MSEYRHICTNTVYYFSCCRCGDYADRWVDGRHYCTRCYEDLADVCEWKRGHDKDEACCSD